MRSLILASSSERRKSIVEFLGVPFRIVHSDFPEEQVRWDDFSDPSEYVNTIAMGKVLVVAQAHPDALILGADTSVFLDGKVFGKPRDLTDARQMLTTLRGREHQVVTGVVLLDTLTGEREVFSVVSSVEFLAFSDEVLDQYIATSESLGKAGSYAIQMGARKLVKQVRGSVSNVVGLPLEETADALERFGIAIEVDVPVVAQSQFSL